MALPIKFPEANSVLRKPSNMTEEQCLDLHVHKSMTNLGTEEKPFRVPQTISCWQFTKEELDEIIANDGKCYIGAIADIHPPIWISGFNPIK